MQPNEAPPQMAGRQAQPAELPASVPQVDLRILQANERTLLAWVRTGLALMGFGFVVARISPWLSEAGVERNGSWAVWTGAAFLVFGTFCNLAAGVRFIRTRAAILAGESVVPGQAAALSLAFGLALLGGLLAVHVLLQ
jgi:putative membrane protein